MADLLGGGRAESTLPARAVRRERAVSPGGAVAGAPGLARERVAHLEESPLPHPGIRREELAHAWPRHKHAGRKRRARPRGRSSRPPCSRNSTAVVNEASSTADADGSRSDRTSAQASACRAVVPRKERDELAASDSMKPHASSGPSTCATACGWVTNARNSCTALHGSAHSAPPLASDSSSVAARACSGV